MSGATLNTVMAGGGNANSNALGSSYAKTYNYPTTSLFARGWVKHQKKKVKTKMFIK